MLLYRIGHSMYANNSDGEGARRNGGRWNHIGTPCIYSSVSRALSLLEYTCHVKRHLIPRDLSFVTYEVPEHSVQVLTVGQLPGNWNHFPHPVEPQDFGTALLKQNNFLLYCVPSVVIEDEMNYIINPLHPDMIHVQIKDIKNYAYDLRLKN